MTRVSFLILIVLIIAFLPNASSGAFGNQPIVWRLQDQSGSAAPDGKYICSIQFKLDGGESYIVFGQLTKSAERVSFIDALRLRAGSPANGAQEFFKRLTASRPDDATAWLWFGQTMCKPSGIIFDPQISPPPPLPQPPPPPPPLKNAGGEQRQKGITTGRSAGPSESDLKEAL